MQMKVRTRYDYGVVSFALLGPFASLSGCQEFKSETDRIAQIAQGGDATGSTISPGTLGGITASSSETSKGTCPNCGTGGTGGTGGANSWESAERSVGGDISVDSHAAGGATGTETPPRIADTGGWSGARGGATMNSSSSLAGMVQDGGGSNAGITLAGTSAGPSGSGGRTTATGSGGSNAEATLVSTSAGPSGSGGRTTATGSGGSNAEATLASTSASHSGSGGSAPLESAGIGGGLGGKPFGSGGTLAAPTDGTGGTTSTEQVVGGSTATNGDIDALDALVDGWPESPPDDTWELAPSALRWDDYIAVCFRSAGVGKSASFNQSQQDAIRRAVTDSWNRVANIRFNNWEPCLPPPAERSRIVIQLDETLPPDVLGTTDRLGAPSAVGGYTTVTFDRADPSERTVIHVFGHVLGFLHPAFDQSCPPGGATADASVADATQASSVMSQVPCRAATQLTPWDVVAAQKAYSRRAPGSLVGMNAQCLDIDIPIEANHGRTQVYECHGQKNQQWRMLGDGKFIAPDPDYSNLYLDVYNGNLEDGTPVALYGPNSVLTANQIWSFESVEIRGIGELCVDALGLGKSATQPPQLRICDGQPTQKWDVAWLSASTIQVRSASAGIWCIQAPEQGGEHLTLAPCAASANQSFTITALGELTNEGLCWSSDAADVQPGRMLQLENCLPAGPNKLHQQYHLHGSLKSGLGKCLTTSTFDFRQHDGTYAYTCANGPDFMWDYYFYPP